MTDPVQQGLSRRGQLAVVGGLVVLLAVAAYVGIGAQGTPGTPPQCQAALTAAAKLAPLAKGDVAIFRPAKASGTLGDLALTDADGKPITLAAFAGKTVLVNFWATWCVPCRQEMPALDRLQAAKGGDTFQVVAVNMDVDSTAEKEKAFLDEVGVKHLALYADPSQTLTADLKDRGLVYGLPTTLLVNPSGCRLGTAQGGAAWDSAQAQTLISAAIAS